jgi:hypothetical protein
VQDQAAGATGAVLSSGAAGPLALLRGAGAGDRLSLAPPGTTGERPVLREDQHTACFHALPAPGGYVPPPARTFTQTG